MSQAEAPPSQSIDLSACDREPIRIPGSIQPHGALLTAEEPSLRVLQHSANTPALLGSAPIGAGTGLFDVLGEDCRPALTHALSTQTLDARPYLLGRYLCGTLVCDVIIHRHDNVLFVECEPTPDDEQTGFAHLYQKVRNFVGALQGTSTIESVCALAAREIHRITGFGRTLVYRFDGEGHGQVLAEEREASYESYLGLHFPASDIPHQARELYRVNHLRLIQTADYAPAPLVPAVNPRTQARTDLSFAVLRSVSPVHLEYMRNMGTSASMSISIIVRGQLWGLISCHDAAPRRVPYAVRAACEHLGQIASLQLEVREDYQETQHRLELRRILVSLLAAVADADTSLERIADSPAELLAFATASGAAVVASERVHLIGLTPARDEVAALVEWLAQRGEDIFASASIAQHYPAARAYATHASGVLAISISQLHRHYIIWFRPEVVQTVQWAGQPLKGQAEGTLRPRASFSAWSETVRGQSLPWRASEEATAAELRAALLSIVLKKAEEMAALAGELGRINKELEAFSYSVSHDLRAPLRHIAGYADLLREYEGTALSERGLRFLANIKSASRFAGQLVDGLLSFSQMGRAALKITRINLDEMVRGIIRALELESGSHTIEWHIGRLPTICADAVFMQVALQNLLANAVKYSRDRSPARISVTCDSSDDAYAIRIADNGVGFNMKYVSKLFGVFQRLHSMDDFDGTGIGLANVRRVVERHGGTVAAIGQTDKGATFTIVLPRHPVEPPARERTVF
jgi:two-component system, chemotaxis family, sensor kinase Cph1